MCVVSMITEHHYDRWPQPTQFPPQQYLDYLELLRKARLYDEMTGQKDCPDPKKEAWQKELEQFMCDKYGLEPKE